jgi:hypothetical protein
MSRLFLSRNRGWKRPDRTEASLRHFIPAGGKGQGKPRKVVVATGPPRVASIATRTWVDAATGSGGGGGGGDAAAIVGGAEVAPAHAAPTLRDQAVRALATGLTPPALLLRRLMVPMSQAANAESGAARRRAAVASARRQREAKLWRAREVVRQSSHPHRRPSALPPAPPPAPRNSRFFLQPRTERNGWACRASAGSSARWVRAGGRVQAARSARARLRVPVPGCRGRSVRVHHRRGPAADAGVGAPAAAIGATAHPQ